MKPLKLSHLFLAVLISASAASIGKGLCTYNADNDEQVNRLLVMPDTEALKKACLQCNIDKHFVEKTKLPQKIAGKELYKLGVHINVENFYTSYYDSLKREGMPFGMVRIGSCQRHCDTNGDLLRSF
jgi:hypothetical protein